MFDGSSIAGWKSIDNSDMKLMPDAASAYIDPFYAQKTLAIFADVVEPDTGEAYERDPRGTARKAEAYLKSSGVGDNSFWGPEAEFFLFDDVRFDVQMNKVGYEVDAAEMLSTMKQIGMKVDKHHHEVAASQHELGMIFGGLVEQADNLQKYKYVIHNVAAAYGKSATFMPKPIAGDNGTGMHVNMSIWKDDKPLFAGNH